MFQIREANGRYCQSMETMSNMQKEHRPLNFIIEYEDQNIPTVFKIHKINILYSQFGLIEYYSVVKYENTQRAGFKIN